MAPCRQTVALSILVVLWAAGEAALGAAAPQKLVVPYTFDALQTLGAGDYTRVSVRGCARSRRVGEPTLPLRVARLVLPPGSKVTGVEARPLADVRTVGIGRPVEFGRVAIPLGSNEARVAAARAADRPKPEVYASDQAYPRNQAELLSVQRMCGYDIAFVRLSPVQYSPKANRLLFCPRLELTVHVAPQGGAIPAFRPRTADARRVAAAVDNPEALGGIPPDGGAATTGGAVPADGPYDYLLVTSTTLSTTFQTLATHKAGLGLAVRVATMETDVAGQPGADTQEKLRNYIKYAYDNWGVQYVLLGGDVSIIPARGAYGHVSGAAALGDYYDDTIPCDLYYACLDGPWNNDGDARWGEPNDGAGGGEVDLLPEVYLGRAPVETEAEAQRFVNKTIAYENNPHPNPDTALLLGESLGGGAQGGDGLDPLLPHLSGYLVNWLDDRVAVWSGTSDCLPALNASPHLVAHSGHTNWNYALRLGNGNLASLTNPGLFLAHSIGCYPGAFDYSDAFAEVMNIGNAAGAFAVVMNSRYGWYNPTFEWMFSGEFQETFFDNLLTKTYHNVGVAHQLSKVDMVGQVEHVDDADGMVYRWCYFEITLFGDPHTPIKTDTTPRNLRVRSFNATPTVNDYFTGLTVTVSPPPDGVTEFTRTYAHGSAVTLTAPQTYGGIVFRRWRLDGVDQPMGQRILALTMTANRDAVAYYAGPGFVITPTSGLQTTEAGGTAQFTVALSTQPTANVTLPLASSDATEGTVSPTSLTFTSANWSQPQTVTVTGADDLLVDGNVDYTIITGPATSSDPAYNGMNAADVSVTNEDNDGQVLAFDFGTATSPLATGYTRVANTTTYSPVVGYGWLSGTIRAADRTMTDALRRDLNYTTDGTFVLDVPIGTYDVTVTMGDKSVARDQMGVYLEGALVDSVTLAVNVFVSHAHRATVVDGQLTVRFKDLGGVELHSAVNAIEVRRVAAQPGITLVPTSGLLTTEAGGTDQFLVVLAAAPTANVTIPLSSSDPSEGTCSPTSLTFTPSNWDQPQTVTVTGVDDSLLDGDVAYTIATGAATSSDPAYNGMNAADVGVTNEDDDTLRLFFDFGTTTSPVEAGYTRVANTTTYSAALGYGWASGTIKGADRTMSDALRRDLNYTTDGTFVADVPVGTYDVTVTMGDKSVARDLMGVYLEGTLVDTVTLAMNEFVTHTHRVSVVDGQLTVRLKDLGGVELHCGANAITVTRVAAPPGIIIVPTSGLGTTEAGGTDQFIVVLAAAPTANVTIPLSSSDPTEGHCSPTSLTFTPSTWDQPQTITVTGLDDPVIDGDVAYAIVTGAATSSDPAYNGMNAADVGVTNEDDDGLRLLFDFGSATSPVAPGYTRVVSTTLYAPALGYGWLSGTIRYADRTMSDPLLRDLNYTTDGTFAMDLPVGTYDVTLTMGDKSVARDLMGMYLEGALVDTVTLAANEFITHTHRVSVLDGQLTVRLKDLGGVELHSSVNAIAVNRVAAQPGIIVNPTSGLATTEAGGTAQFVVVLAAAPAANVTIPLSSSDPTEGSCSPAGLTFTPSDWDQPQTVAVAGVDDTDIDGDVAYTIVTGAATSSDPAYNGMDADDVGVTNEDNDGVSYKFDFGTATSPVEAGYTRVVSTTTYSPALGYGWLSGTIKVADRTMTDPLRRDLNYTTDGTFVVDVPIGTFDVVVTMGDKSVARDQMGIYLEGTLVDSVTLAMNEFVTHTYRVDVTDGQLTVRLKDLGGVELHSAVNAIEVNCLAATPGIMVNPTSGLRTTEAGGTAQFIVVLSGAPSASVSIPLSSSDPTEGSCAPTSLTFTTSNWNQPQTVTVTGVDETEIDGDMAYTIVTGPAVSSDPVYNGMNADDVSVTNEDNDGVRYAFDFGMATSPVAPGYTQVTSTTLYAPALGYGWLSGTIKVADRTMADPLRRDLNYTTDGTFVVDVPAGGFDVTITMGDKSVARDQMGIHIEGTLVDTVTLAMNEFVTRTYRVDVTDGQLTIRLKDLGGVELHAAVNAIEVAMVGVGGLGAAAAAPVGEPLSLAVLPERGVAPLEVTAIAAGGPAGAECVLDFGDGSTARGSMAVHTYLSPGTYTVTARAGGAVAQATVVVTEPASRK